MLPDLLPVKQWYAQIENEVLTLAWACERFQDYITRHFLLERPQTT